MRIRGQRRAARGWHLLTAVVTAAGLIIQLVLVIDGAPALIAEEQPALGVRLVRFVSYFTILSNILVLYATSTLIRRPERDGPVWRVLRLDAVIGITVTGLVHWFFLRPLLSLSGTAYLADKLLHVAVPLLAVVGWAAFGPRRRIRPRDLGWVLIYPLGWLAYTLVRGAILDWYPYPFVNATTLGYGRVTVNCVGIGALLFGLSALAMVVDRRLPDASTTRVRPRPSR